MAYPWNVGDQLNAADLNTAVRGVSLTAGQAFTAGQAAYMDLDSNCGALASASSQYLSSTAAAFALNSDLTLECWVNFTSTPGAASNMTIISKEDSSAGYRFTLTNSSGLKLGFDVGGAQVFVTWTPSTSTWYHVAVVYTKAAGSATFYVNGVQQGTTQTGLSTSIGASSHALAVGADFTGGASTPANFLNGKVDAPRVWNTARTGGAISADYNLLLFGAETNLLGYWALNGDLTDRTSNVNTLTNNGSATFSTSTAGITGQYPRLGSASLADTATTFIGFATASIPALAAGTFATHGVVSVFSGLTQGVQYLSNTSGAIATTAGTVTRKVGIALSTTTLLITNIW